MILYHHTMKKRTYIAPALQVIAFDPDGVLLNRSLETTDEEMDGSNFLTKKKEKTIWNSEPGKFE